MAKNNYVVPKNQQHAYKMMVQRANRRVKSNLKYIEKHNIQNEHTQRSLVGGFAERGQWASATMPFSRSNKGRYIIDADTGVPTFREFENEREFRQYMAYLNKWGEQTEKGGRFSAHPEQIKSNYKSAIIKALNEVKDHYSITMPGGQIPKEIINELDKLNLEQITNFFANGDPSEDVEISQFSSDDFIYVENAEDFKDVVLSRISAIKQYH